MKAIKIALTIVVFGFLAALFFQNKEFFLSQHSLGMNLYFAQKQIPALPNVVLFVIFFLFGWLIAYFFSLFDRFKSNRTIKNLKSQIASYRDDLDQLKREVDLHKASRAQQPAMTPEAVSGERPSVEPSAEADDAQTPQSTH
jgi:hypothetical protein